MNDQDLLKQLFADGGTLVVLVWFMLRNEKRMERLVSKVNRLILATTTVMRTMKLDHDSDELADAVDESGDADRGPSRKG